PLSLLWSRSTPTTTVSCQLSPRLRVPAPHDTINQAGTQGRPSCTSREKRAMVIDTAIALAAAIRGADLLDPEQQSQLEGDLPARFPDPRDLARHLLHTDWLTAFQVNQLLQGNGSALRVGPYILLERLGAGAMGEVFKVRHRRLGSLAALKVIRKHRLTHPN